MDLDHIVSRYMKEGCGSGSRGVDIGVSAVDAVPHIFQVLCSYPDVSQALLEIILAHTPENKIPRTIPRSLAAVAQMRSHGSALEEETPYPKPHFSSSPQAHLSVLPHTQHGYDTQSAAQADALYSETAAL